MRVHVDGAALVGEPGHVVHEPEHEVEHRKYQRGAIVGVNINWDRAGEKSRCNGQVLSLIHISEPTRRS
eukprot:2262693-Prymnesium_polylepis.1